MARLREPIQLIENAAAGRRCMITIPVGRTWMETHIEHGGLTLAQMTDIRVILVTPIKTITLQEFKDGTELNNMNVMYGRYTVAGTLSFYFRKPEMENEAQSMATAIGTGGLQSFRIEFNIAPATTPNITAWGRKTANRHVTESILPYIANHNVGGQAVGNNHFDNIEKRDRIIGIHVLNQGVTGLYLKVDDAVVFDLARARSDIDQRVGGRLPYAASYGQCIDFTTSGVLDESLVMQDGASAYQVQQMRLTTTLGGTIDTTTRILVEYLTTFQSLAGANTLQAA